MLVEFVCYVVIHEEKGVPYMGGFHVLLLLGRAFVFGLRTKH